MNTVEICVTSSCNLRCRHCYQDSDKNRYELPIDKILAVIDFAEKNNANRVVVSGGEASIHPQFPHIVRRIGESSLKATIVTNATILDVGLFQKYQSDKFSFVVSVDGTKERHNLRRGSGTYEKMMETVLRLKELGCHIRANITVVPDNCEDIPELLRMDLFDECSFMPVALVGAAKNNGIDSTSRGYEMVLRELYNIDMSVREHKCSIYPKGISIRYTGDVYPCSLARDYDILKMGNLNETSIDSIVAEFEKSVAYKLICEKAPRACVQECNSCKHTMCTRGCCIRAYKYNGHFDTPDPFCCKLFNNGYEDISFSCLYWGDCK